MANCTVTLTVNSAALSGAVRFEPMPNQVVAGVVIDTTPITATASGTTYTATLIQGARYWVHSSRVRFLRPIFRVPASATADLDDLMDELS